MTVHCERECHVIEQLGEKQDFESALSRRQFKHDDFILYVLRENHPGGKSRWSPNYSVSVTNVKIGRTNTYAGGPNRDWEAKFSVDLAKGVFGHP